MTNTAHFPLTVPGTDTPLRESGGRLEGGGAKFAELGDRIWDLTLPDRAAVLDGFARDYAAVRQAEGRELSPTDITRLPRLDPTHPSAEIWAPRAASFDRFAAALEATGHPPGYAVDIGAGCGWLAAALDDRGWTCAASDIMVEGVDGLRSGRHHSADLLLIRAEMERMPFTSSSIDLAVFNASLHYAGSVSGALDEACRILRPGGVLAVVDSPVFSNPAAGAAMVSEFATQAERTFGLAPAAHEGRGFVQWDELDRYNFTVHHDVAGIRRRIHQKIGARRAGREVASRPVLLALRPTTEDPR